MAVHEVTENATPVAIVTGASGGIGAATARLLAEQGYAVCVNYRSSAAAARAVAAELGTAIAVKADVSNEAEVVHLFETVDRELGRVTALVNNAAIVHAQARVEAMTAERINATLVNNVTSAFLCAREAVKRMSTRHGGPGGAIVYGCLHRCGGWPLTGTLSGLSVDALPSNVGGIGTE